LIEYLLLRILYNFATKHVLSAEFSNVASESTWLPVREKERITSIEPHLEIGCVILQLRGRKSIDPNDCGHVLHQRAYTAANPDFKVPDELNDNRFFPGTLIFPLGVFTPTMYVCTPSEPRNHRPWKEDHSLYIPCLEERGMTADVHEGNGPYWNPILFVDIFSKYQTEEQRQIIYPSFFDAKYSPTYYYRFMTLSEKLWHFHLFIQHAIHCVKELSVAMVTATTVGISMLMALNDIRYCALEKRIDLKNHHEPMDDEEEPMEDDEDSKKDHDETENKSTKSVQSSNTNPKEDSENHLSKSKPKEDSETKGEDGKSKKHGVTESNNDAKKKGRKPTRESSEKSSDEELSNNISNGHPAYVESHGYL
jgi:hypothetical protein